MVATASLTNGTVSTTAQAGGGAVTAEPGRNARSAPSEGAASSSSPAVTLDVSARAKALAQALAQDIPASFDEMVTKRTSDFAAKLTAGLAGAHVPLDEPIKLWIDDGGAIRADGPYKKKIEAYFKDNPEAAEEFKTVATLNALRAAQEVLRLQNEELASARSDEERAAARNRQMLRSMDIQAVAGRMTLDRGELVSAATVYTDALDPERLLPRALADRDS